MTLTAIDSRGKRVTAWDCDDWRMNPEHKHLRHPIIDVPVFPVRAHFRSDKNFVRQHFRMKSAVDFPDTLHKDDDYIKKASNGRLVFGESMEHLESKKAISKWAYMIDPVCREDLSSFEVTVKMPDDRWRIIDVAFETPTGLILAHECQLSPITPDELDERTTDYQSVGIDVVWWFGYRADTPENHAWNKHRLGFTAPRLTYETEVDSLS